MKRQYTICTEHLIVFEGVSHEYCEKCDNEGFRDEENLVYAANMDDLIVEMVCPKHGVNVNHWRQAGKQLVEKCGAVSGYGDICQERLEAQYPWSDNSRYAPPIR